MSSSSVWCFFVRLGDKTDFATLDVHCWIEVLGVFESLALYIHLHGAKERQLYPVALL